MGKGKNDTVKRSMNFDRWMYSAIEEIATKKGLTFTTVVIELLRQGLEDMGITMGIGRESGEPVFKKEDIERMFSRSSNTEPLDLGDSQAG